MSTYGTQSNFHPTSHGNPPDGTLILTYDFTVTPATGSFTYTGPGVGAPTQGPYTVTWGTTVNGVAPGTAPTVTEPGNQPLNITGEGSYKSATLNFTIPTTNPNTPGALSGEFFKNASVADGADDDDLTWDADAASPDFGTKAGKAGATGKY